MYCVVATPKQQWNNKILNLRTVLFFFFAFCFLGLYPQHKEAPRLGAESELQLLAYTTATATPIQAVSVTYTAAHGKARSLTHWARPGTEPASSWILVRFVTVEPRRELPGIFFGTRPHLLVAGKLHIAEMPRGPLRPRRQLREQADFVPAHFLCFRITRKTCVLNTQCLVPTSVCRWFHELR